VAWALIVAGAILVLFTFLLAFTIYGEIALVLGAVCIATGGWMTARNASDRGSGTTR